MSDQLISIYDNTTKLYYDFDEQNKKIYKIKTNNFFLTMTVLLIMVVIILIIYDYIKDTLRYFSGIKNISSGDIGVGSVKFLGYTKGNITRGIAIFITSIITIISSILSAKREEITYDQVPDYIKLKFEQKSEKNAV
jgi:hypothetical protein